ncbi:hypothetical protein QR680_004149 [Steinernema hermaphroditum]|uniref:RING-type domain-containing protein n=1 Tax=Steinernema hermaphroditum TaxID=289476 RepID=A0AA39HMU3_9BILA|nr:hypothetical protein QR680_004149 [Steinernema hermaphroditum]
MDCTASTSPSTFSFIDSDFKDEPDNTLKCPICLEEFDVPKFLSCCGRSICRTCEQNVNNSRQSYDRRCPICNTRGGLTNRSLPVNVDLKNANDLLKSEKDAINESLKNTKPKLICEQCDQDMYVDTVYCCVRCDPKKKICSHCVIKDHKLHEIEDITYVPKEEREELVTDITKKVGNIENLTFDSDDFKKCLELTSANYRKAKDILKEVVIDDYQTRDDIERKLSKAKKIIIRVKKDYVNILKLKESIATLERELEVDVSERI